MFFHKPRVCVPTRMLGVMAAVALFGAPVITSYSIHYTKLYESATFSSLFFVFSSATLLPPPRSNRPFRLSRPAVPRRRRPCLS